MSDKAATNRKWVSSPKYRDQYDAIFRKDHSDKESETKEEVKQDECQGNKKEA